MLCLRETIGPEMFFLVLKLQETYYLALDAPLKLTHFFGEIPRFKILLSQLKKFL